MPNDTYTLLGLAVGAVVVLWLVFSVLRKVLGIVLLVAIAVGGYVLWNNPELVPGLPQLLARFLGKG